MATSPPSESFLRECRLILEEACCNLYRFRLAAENRVEPEDVTVRQEAALDVAGAFADIRLSVPGGPVLFVEVKYGYPVERIGRHLERKFRLCGPMVPPGSRLLVIADGIETAALTAAVDPAIALDVLPVEGLLDLLRETYGVEIPTLDPEAMGTFRDALDRAKGRQAFGDAWVNDELQGTLLWHFGHLRLRRLHREGTAVEEIFPQGLYRNVIALLVDLCSFSSYVRDTRDDAVIRDCLTSFYAKSRYAILNTGGMMYQFVGDEVIGLYGLPDRREGDFDRALECACALREIGDSISDQWQRNIDRVQNSRGVHIGIAQGDLQVLGLQPFSKARLGAVSDAINLGARLLSAAGPGEIVVSNSFHKGLAANSQTGFQATEPIEAKNLGRINAWRLGR